MLLNQRFDSVRVINIPARTDRLERIRNRLREQGIKATWAEGFPTADGVGVPAHWQAAWGAYGCMLAHRKVYEQTLKAGMLSVVIFEDDAVFTDRFSARLEDFLQQVPHDWQMIYLGCNNVEPAKPVAAMVGRVRKAYTTHAYILRPPAMRAMLDNPEMNTEAIDVALGRVQHRMPVYCAIPSLVTQEAGVSDILGEYKDYTQEIR